MKNIEIKNKKLASYFIELTKDALLKAYWRKTALKRFLRQHEISENYCSRLDTDTTKNGFLEELFSDLSQSNERHPTILKIAMSLAEMKSYPDLEKWDDSKEKISSAYRARAKLKIEIDKITSKIEKEQLRKETKDRVAKEQKEILKSQQAIQKLKDRLDLLCAQIGTSKAGYDFEKWIYDFTQLYDLNAKLPYQDSHGRQIDGAITLQSFTFLIETKFTKDPVGSPDIDTFMAKIKRKADNTMGIMISIYGFNPNAIKTASVDKTPIILMDGMHFYNLIFSHQMTLPEVIERIWRNAGQTGQAFLAAKDF